MNPSPVMSSRMKVALAGLATLLVALMVALGCQGSDGSDSEQEIIFYDLAWGNVVVAKSDRRVHRRARLRESSLDHFG